MTLGEILLASATFLLAVVTVFAFVWSLVVRRMDISRQHLESVLSELLHYLLDLQVTLNRVDIDSRVSPSSRPLRVVLLRIVLLKEVVSVNDRLFPFRAFVVAKFGRCDVTDSFDEFDTRLGKHMELLFDLLQGFRDDSNSELDSFDALSNSLVDLITELRNVGVNRKLSLGVI